METLVVGKPQHLLLLLVVLLCISFAVRGQAPNLEELESRLKQEQAAEDARKSEAQKRAAIERRNSEQVGTLVVESDAECELRIDGDPKGVLKLGEVKSVQVRSGEQLIDCTSTASNKHKVREVREVAAGAKLVITLRLAAQIEQSAEANAGVNVTASGLKYQILRVGTGRRPGASDTVETHYEGRLLDGTKFDSSYDRGQSATFPLNAVIPGWQEALQLMQVGAKFRLWIPPNLAYGERGVPGIKIGPNATLVFDVELLAIK